MLSQLKNISEKRLLRKLGMVSAETFNDIRRELANFIAIEPPCKAVNYEIPFFNFLQERKMAAVICGFQIF